MIIDPATLDRNAAHDLLKSCVVPRPIAWVSTAGPGGVANAAPYSCFTFVALEPPMLCLSIELKPDGTKKDTLVNIERTQDFVINLVAAQHAEAMNATAADFPSDESEILAVGLTPRASERVEAPRIAECAVNLECRLERILELGRSRHSLVIGEVVLAHVRDDLYRDGQIDGAALDLIGRLGGNQYAHTREVFEIGRPWLEDQAPKGGRS